MLKIAIISILFILLSSCSLQDKNKTIFDFSEKGEYIYPNISFADSNSTNYLPSNFTFRKGDSIYIEPTGYDFEKIEYVKYPWLEDTVMVTEKLAVEYIYNLINIPILWNSYLDEDIYRIYINRSFHPIEVYIFTKKENKVSSTQYIFKFEKDSISNSKKAIVNKEVIKEWSIKEWDKFEELILDDNFWNLSPKNQDEGSDGTTWVIEGHKKNQYRFIHRWGSSSMFSSATYLINLCNFNSKNETIY